MATNWLKKYQDAGSVMPADVLTDPKKMAQWMKDHPEATVANANKRVIKDPRVVSIDPRLIKYNPPPRAQETVDYLESDPRNQSYTGAPATTLLMNPNQIQGEGARIIEGGNNLPILAGIAGNTAYPFIMAAAPFAAPIEGAANAYFGYEGAKAAGQAYNDFSNYDYDQGLIHSGEAALGILPALGGVSNVVREASPFVRNATLRAASTLGNEEKALSRINRYNPNISFSLKTNNNPDFIHQDLFYKKRDELLKNLDSPEGRKRLQEIIDYTPRFKGVKPDDLIEFVKGTQFRHTSPDPIEPHTSYFEIDPHTFETSVFVGPGFTPYEAEHAIEHELMHNLQAGDHTALDFQIGRGTFGNLKKLTPAEEASATIMGKYLSQKKPKHLPYQTGYDPSYYNVTEPGTSTTGHLFRLNPHYFDDVKNSGLLNQQWYYNINGGVERSPFLAEVRENMLQRGLIKNRYDEVTPEMVKQHFDLYSRSNPETKQYLRYYDIQNPKKINFRNTADDINSLPAILPYAIPTAAAAASVPKILQNYQGLQQQQNGGWLTKYQDGTTSAQPTLTFNTMPAGTVGMPPAADNTTTTVAPIITKEEKNKRALKKLQQSTNEHVTFTGKDAQGNPIIAPAAGTTYGDNGTVVAGALLAGPALKAAGSLMNIGLPYVGNVGNALTIAAAPSAAWNAAQGDYTDAALLAAPWALGKAGEALSPFARRATLAAAKTLGTEKGLSSTKQAGVLDDVQEMITNPKQYFTKEQFPREEVPSYSQEFKIVNNADNSGRHIQYKGNKIPIYGTVNTGDKNWNIVNMFTVGNDTQSPRDVMHLVSDDGEFQHFYKSSGTNSGKTLGSWYPYEGYSTNGWFIKGAAPAERRSYDIYPKTDPRYGRGSTEQYRIATILDDQYPHAPNQDIRFAAKIPFQNREGVYHGMNYPEYYFNNRMTYDVPVLGNPLGGYIDQSVTPQYIPGLTFFNPISSPVPGPSSRVIDWNKVGKTALGVGVAGAAASTPTILQNYEGLQKHKDGGWLNKYQNGSKVYVSSATDPRYTRYKDSLDLYNYYKLQTDLENPSGGIQPGRGDGSIGNTLAETGNTLYNMFDAFIPLTDAQKKIDNTLFQTAANIIKNNPNLTWGTDFPAVGEDSYEAYKNAPIHSPDIKTKNGSIKATGSWMGYARNNDYSNVKPHTEVVVAPPVKLNQGDTYVTQYGEYEIVSDPNSGAGVKLKNKKTGQVSEVNRNDIASHIYKKDANITTPKPVQKTTPPPQVKKTTTTTAATPSTQTETTTTTTTTTPTTAQKTTKTTKKAAAPFDPKRGGFYSQDGKYWRYDINGNIVPADRNTNNGMKYGGWLNKYK